MKVSVVRHISLFQATLRGTYTPCFLGTSQRTFTTSHARLNNLASKAHGISKEGSSIRES